MKICGIVAEFNPFHNGHQYIINKIKGDNTCILSVMSGNFVQRGEPAVFSKFTRAEAALNCGVDLVVELPSPWSASCAQNFSYGAISLLKNCEIDKIVFGSETDSIDSIKKIAKTDRNLTFTEADLKSGRTYAQIRQNALSKQIGIDCAEILEGANNNLGIEYLKAMMDLDCNFEAEAIKRCGADHDSTVKSEDICSASYLREQIKNGNSFDSYIPQQSSLLYEQNLKSGRYMDFEFFERDILSYLRRLPSFGKFPDVSEGIDNKIFKELRTAGSYQELLMNIKSKRYTLARIRRILLAAYLDMNCDWFLKEVPYINVLGFKKRRNSS